jgi:trk system potassium uptake protein TrkA
MYIIVIGGGQLGYHLTKALLAENHEVLLIERDAKTSQKLIDELGSVAMRGDGCEASVLAKAGTSRADMLVAVTGDDADNLVACQVAKHKFAVPRTIARVRNPRNESLFRKLGVDVTVSSTNLILEHIEHEMPSHPLMHLMVMRDRSLEIVEVTIPAGSASVGKKIKDLALPVETVLSLIVHSGQKPVIPGPDTIISAEDQVIAIVPAEAEDSLRSALTGS